MGMKGHNTTQRPATGQEGTLFELHQADITYGLNHYPIPDHLAQQLPDVDLENVEQHIPAICRVMSKASGGWIFRPERVRVDTIETPYVVRYTSPERGVVEHRFNRAIMVIGDGMVCRWEDPSVEPMVVKTVDGTVVAERVATS